MKQITPILLIFFLLGCSPSAKNKDIFSLHLFEEPQQLDPAKGRSSSASYFFFSIFRGLYINDKEKGLTPENGKCHWKSQKTLLCKLSRKFKWSNGTDVTSKDYQRAFSHLINPKTAAPRADLLIHVKNGKAILNGKKQPEDLGFKPLDSHSFEVHFEQPDPEFIYKLTSTALFPKHKDNPENKSEGKILFTNGPYRIKDWKSGQQVLLTKNEFYPLGYPGRPDVLMLFIDSDLTAFRLYEQGRLQFLRRALPRFVEKLKGRDDFYRFPQARFDYIGFGHPVNKSRQLRKALTLSIDYQASIKVLEALGPLGCPSLPTSWLDKRPCYPFDIVEAKKAFAKVPPEVLKQKLVYGFSMLGGPVLKKQAEFLQNQWKKNLGLHVELRMIEQKMYLKNLKAKPLPLFRKGVGVDRASCADALETFTKDNPENYTNIFNPHYEKLTQAVSKETDTLKRKTLCRQAVDILMKDYLVIPLGEMHFAILSRPRFSGWKLNELNQLDLSHLKLSTP